MSALTVAAALAIYAAALFAVGWRAQARPPRSERVAALYCALSIGVYATSWTFYGAVGSAATSGWDYLPIYLGPILLYTLGLPVVRRLVDLGKAHASTSLSDILSRRFGRSRRLAAFVTLFAVVAVVPYVALQLLAVASTFAAVTGMGEAPHGLMIVAVAAVLALFGLVFGTRNLDITKPNPGLVGAIAFDSVFKLAAFLAIGIFSLFVLNGLPEGTAEPRPMEEPVAWDRFVILTFLSMAAMLCLPRQFHMTVVEPASAARVMRAAPILVLYLAAFAAFVVPITAAGQAVVSGVRPDLYVLALPAAEGAEALTLLAFVGGFAAAAGMIVVTGVALSIMVATDLLMPLFLRRSAEEGAWRVLVIRRVSLPLLMALAAIFALMVPADARLAGLGTVSFAAVAQFAPLLIAAAVFGRATEPGAVAGLSVGAGAWFFFVFCPALLPGSPLDAGAVAEAMLPMLSDDFSRGAILSLGLNALSIGAVSLLIPESLEEREGAARFAALGAPRAMAGAVSAGDLRALLMRCVGAQEAAACFAAYEREAGTPLDARAPVPAALLAQAETHMSKVLGNASAHILVTRLLSGRGIGAGDVMVLIGEASEKLSFSQDLLSTTLDNLAEGVSVIDKDMRLVAWNRAFDAMFGYPPGFLAVGRPVEDLLEHNLRQASQEAVARRVQRLRAGEPHTHETTLPDGRIVRLQGRPVPGGGYVTSFSDVTEYRTAQANLKDQERRTRFYTDNIPFPIAYADGRGVVRFHNRAYADMAGRPGENLEDLPLRNVLGEGYDLRAEPIEAALGGQGQRFELSPEALGGKVTWQVTYVPQLSDDGEVQGFFGFYQDISQRRRAQRALEEANRSLESRVARRTRLLEDANTALDEARREAEAANRSKTRFLAAASHDVLQPLNAARLFASSLEDDLPEGSAQRSIAARIGAAVASADTLLRSLLNLSKLDAGGVDPRVEVLALGPFLDEIAQEFAPFAASKDLSLKAIRTTLCIRTDPGLLRSALQNLVSNALRYTDEGGVVIGSKRRGGQADIVIADTGRGIEEADKERIFEEFSRLPRDRDVTGAGLGLATVKRVCALLGHEVTVSSVPGQGTVFAVRAPKAEAEARRPAGRKQKAAAFAGRRVLCVDNDLAVLDAMRLRYDRWGAKTLAFASLGRVKEAFDAGAEAPELCVLDYQLDDHETGLDVLRYLREVQGITCPAIMVTASRSEETDGLLKEAGVPVLAKPVEPAALRALSAKLLEEAEGEGVSPQIAQTA